MPRLRDARTGVVVEVDDDTAEALSAAYKPVEADKPKPASKKSSKPNKG